MTVQTIFSGVAAVQQPPTFAAGGAKGSNLPQGSQMIDLSSGGALTNVSQASNQAFMLTVDAPSSGSTVSATAQILGSNDGVHWIGVGTITIGSGPSPGMGSLAGTTPFAFFSGYLTAISGPAGTKATLTMNA